MKLESQVVSLELAKRLKELGVKQESAFYWKNECGVETIILTQTKTGCPVCSWTSAFSVAELGEMLCRPGRDNMELPRWEMWKWWVLVEDKHIVENTEADARARMLIHLIEQKLVKP